MSSDSVISEDDLNDLFKQWLIEGGAEFEKIQWPSNETESGVRGAIATCSIKTGEYMIKIPAHLMISPPIIFGDPVIGDLLKSSSSILQGDLLLSVFLMYEFTKKESSFYYPYLRILPTPGNISEWTDSDLKMLQDDVIYMRAKNRRTLIKQLYEKSVVILNQLHRELFPLESFTFDLFKFCWNSVQARAFGRRLPWTAMVPFADCLNHSNVQTKYDYDINNNKVFRLFPSGNNSYPNACEVFNSYGRRNNENLLQDYGFSIFENEWDEVDIYLNLGEEDECYEKKIQILNKIGLSSYRNFRLNKCGIALEILIFLRVINLEVDDINKLESRNCIDVNHSEELTSEMKNLDEYELIELRRERRKNGSIFNKIISLDNELKCLNQLKNYLLYKLTYQNTTIERDTLIQQTLISMRDDNFKIITSSDCLEFDVEYNTEIYWKYLNSVNYRLTRKLIILNEIRMINILINWFKYLKNENIQTVDEDCVKDRTEYLDLNLNNFINYDWLRRNDERIKEKIKQFQNYLLSTNLPSQWPCSN